MPSYAGEYKRIFKPAPKKNSADGTLRKTLERSGGYDSMGSPVAYLRNGRVAVIYNSGYSRKPRGYAVWDISGDIPIELWYY